MFFVREELSLFTHSHNKHLLSTYSIPAIVHSAGDTEMKHSLAKVTDICADGHNTLAGSMIHTGLGSPMKAQRGRFPLKAEAFLG